MGRYHSKFKNGLYLYGLLPNEHILGFVSQPGFWEQRWHLFSLKMSEITLPTLTVKQLIVVEEKSQSRFPDYGWIFTFYPQKAIERVGAAPNRDWHELIVKMKSEGGFKDRRILMDQTNVLTWSGLWSWFRNLRTIT